MEKLRIGIIGAGANTRLRHIPGFQEIEGVEVVQVANRSLESAQKVAEAFGIPQASGRWQDVIENPDIDAVCIGTWPYLHAEATIAALEAGKHVLTEARLAMNLEEAEGMLEVAEQHPNLVAQVVPSPFTLNVDRAVKAWLAAGKAGHLREVHVTHTHAALARSDAPMTWRQDPEVSGCNLLTVGIYHEVVLRWLNPEITALQARGCIHTRERKHWDRPGETAEIALPDTVSIWAEDAAQCQYFYHFSGVESGLARNEIRIHGDQASLRCDVAAEKVWIAEAGSNEERELEIPEADKVGWRVEADFIDSIREGKPVELTSFADGVRYMAFSDALVQALEVAE
ncbi:MAG: Gfo/Idh/MocA family oxidoreductase [Opitutales bacterium]|nr:Gfo/Idh/MocA family oxidoreductase [Opitutales bacterium]